ncbi:MAG TPA: DUF3048 C-terminal domain-containing protein [Anaerolineales bacterium]|nr:DUF3048 C-terminal domain-containing protein [Anaerolineales bacterium]
MNTQRNFLFTLLLLIPMVLSSCKIPLVPEVNAASDEITNEQLQVAQIATSTSTSVPEIEPTELPTEVPTSTPTLTPTPVPAVYGPALEDFPAGINPLTGLVVPDPALLDLPAVLISITNFPPSARPQSGLSFASWVYELYISEGMTRFLTVFYGNYPRLNIPETDSSTNTADPTSTPDANNNGSGTTSLTDPGTAGALNIGPIRSGRLPWAYIRDFYQNGCLVYAGATVQIRERLKGCGMVYGSDPSDINSAMLTVDDLKLLAEQNSDPNNNFNYSGNFFSENVPQGGQPADQMDVYYSFLNQGKWELDPASGRYLKFEDFADGSGLFRPMTDRVNGDQLAFSNVIVLYADHEVLDPFIIDVNLQSGEKGKALIFRDGQKFEAVWSTMNDEYEKTTGLRRPLRFEYPDGTPFPLKPGQSWVHIFTHFSNVEDKGDGKWLFRFIAPAGTY